MLIKTRGNTDRSNEMAGGKAYQTVASHDRNKGEITKIWKLQTGSDSFPEENTSWLCRVLNHIGRKGRMKQTFRAMSLLSQHVMLSSVFLFVKNK